MPVETEESIREVVEGTGILREPILKPYLLTPAQAARYLGVQRNTLAIWRTRGEGPPFIKVSRHRNGRVLYRVSDLEEWANRGAQRTIEEGWGR